MTSRPTTPEEFNELRPRLRALLELHRAAATEETRRMLAGQFEDVFLTTAWHVARDLLENGWSPGFAAPAAVKTPIAVRGDHLRLVVFGDDQAEAHAAGDCL